MDSQGGAKSTTLGRSSPTLCILNAELKDAELQGGLWTLVCLLHMVWGGRPEAGTKELLEEVEHSVHTVGKDPCTRGLSPADDGGVQTAAVFSAQDSHQEVIWHLCGF